MNEMRNPRVSFVSLGCPKALVDSERIITRCAPKAMNSRATMRAPMSSSSTLADFSTAPRAESLEPRSASALEGKRHGHRHGLHGRGAR